MVKGMADHRQALLNLRESSHAGGDDQWPTGLTKGPKQRTVSQLTRGHFVEWQIKSFQKCQALGVEGSGQKFNTKLVCMSLERGMPLERQLQSFKHLKLALSCLGRTLLVGSLRGGQRGQTLSVKGLEFYSISPSVGSGINQIEGPLPITVMVNSGFSNYISCGCYLHD